MSGGFFAYENYKINQIVDTIQNVIDNNSDDSLNEWGDTKGRFYSDETIALFKDTCILLKAGAALAHRIDYLLEGDDSEESFLRRVEEDFVNLNKVI